MSSELVDTPPPGQLVAVGVGFQIADPPGSMVSTQLEARWAEGHLGNRSPHQQSLGSNGESVG